MTDCEKLRERLGDMGYEVEENEYSSLSEALGRAEQSIVNMINCEKVPEELHFTLLDMAAGEYLLAAQGKNGEDRVKSVSEGDVSVSFDTDGEEELIDRLLNSGRDELLSFRRLKW